MIKIDLDIGESNIVRYCKGHYARSNNLKTQIEDLRFLAARAATNAATTGDITVVAVMTGLIRKCGLADEVFKNDFMAGVICGGFTGDGAAAPFERFMDKTSGMLCLLPIHDQAKGVIIQLQPLDQVLLETQRFQLNPYHVKRLFDSSTLLLEPGILNEKIDLAWYQLFKEERGKCIGIYADEEFDIFLYPRGRLLKQGATTAEIRLSAEQT